MITPLLLSSALALAAEPATPDWHTSHQVALAYFPIGLRYAYSGEYRVPLWDEEGSTLFGQTFLAPGVYFEATPAYVRVGPSVSFKPIAIFDISAEAIGFAYFGTFSGLTVFDSPEAWFGQQGVSAAEGEGCTSVAGDPSLCFPDAVLDANHAANGKNGGYGMRLTVSPTLKAKAGPIIIAIPGEYSHYIVAKPKGETGDWFYEPQLDALLGFSEHVISSTPVLFYEIRKDSPEDERFFWAGLRADYQNVLGSEDVSARLGPIAVFDPGKTRAVPTFVVFTQAYLKSPIHPMFPPYVAVAAIW